MQLTHLKTLDTGRRVQGFLDTQAAPLGTAVPVPLRAQLDAAVGQLAAYQVEQATALGAAKGETASQTAIRRDLDVRFLKPISRITKHALRGVAEFQNLVVPAVALHQADFLGKVNALADAAAKYEKTFVDNGLPADFVAQLRADNALLTASVDNRSRLLSRRSAATAGMKAADKSVKSVVGVLDSVLKHALKKNPALLADWMASKRIPQPAVTPLPNGGTSAPASSTAQPQTATPAPVTPPAAA